MPEERFDVVDPVDVGDLSDVQENPILPATKRVKCVVKRVNANSNKDKTWRWLNAGLQIKDGLDAQGKYKNMYVNTDNICYYADPTLYQDAVQDKRHLGKLKNLLKATGLLGRKVDDQLIQDMKGKQVYADIIQIQDDYVGELVNRAVRLREVPIEEQV